MGMLTPAKVLQLQRIVGNKAVQRLLTTKSHSSLLQRAPDTETKKEGSGIQHSATIDQYVNAVQAYVDSPANADKPIAELVNVMAGQLYIALATAQVPQPSVVVQHADGDSANFNNVPWNITVDPNEVFQGAKTVRELRNKGTTSNRDFIIEAASTFYHEGRHAEQDFRVAQMLAGNWINKGDEGNADAQKRAADAIHARTHTRMDIALQATQHPLREGEVDKALLDEAKAWYKSMYGADAYYRHLVYTLEDLNLELNKFVKELDTELSNTYLMPPDEKLKFERDILPQRLARFNQLLDGVMPYKDNQVQTEMNRINQIPQPRRTPNTAVMLRHLSSMSIFLMKIGEKRPTNGDLVSVHHAATDIDWFSDQLKETLHQADIALPEQADAIATEEKVAQSANKTP
jgi:hypothetical protein